MLADDRQRNFEAGLKVIVYEIIEPRPMIFYGFPNRTPNHVMEVGREYGADLVKGAWMPPHGSGERADVMISVGREIVLARDFDQYELLRGGPMLDRSATSAVNTWIQYRFPYAGEGGYIAPQPIPVRSHFSGPHQAATSGYRSVLRWSRIRFSAYDLHTRQKMAFPPVFRIRVSATATMRLPDESVVPRTRWKELAEHGAIDDGGCLYGRIVRPKTDQMTVSVNPDPTSRSLEPDMRFITQPPGTQPTALWPDDE